MSRVMLMVALAGLALIVAFGSPTPGFGEEAQPGAEGVGPETEPTPAGLPSPPSIVGDAGPRNVDDVSIAPDAPAPEVIVNSPGSPGNPAAPICMITSSEGDSPEPDCEITPESQPEATATVAPLAVPTPATATGSEPPLLAQGLVTFGIEEFVWRVVQYQTDSPDTAEFAERPLGFVLATDGPVLLVDQTSGERTVLAPAQAELVQRGARQQRTSPAEERVKFLSIELVPADSATDAPNGTILRTFAPFLPPLEPQVLLLMRYPMAADNVLKVPDTGQRNLVLVLEGTVLAGPSGGRTPESLPAGESQVFRGAWEVTIPTSIDSASVVVALMGPTEPRPSLPSVEEKIVP